MNGTVIRLAAAALLGQKRVWALLAFPILLLALAAALRFAGLGADGYQIVSDLAYPILLPLVALLATSSVLGPEIDDGSVVYLLAKPVNRHVVVVSKFVVAWAATMVAGVAPLYLAGLILDPAFSNLSAAWTLGGVVAGTAYCALFIALSALTRHAVVAGLLFVLVWEALLGGTLSGIAWVSVRQWGARLASEFDGGIAAPDLPLAYALGAAAALLVAGVWLAGDRLRSFTLTGD